MKIQNINIISATCQSDSQSDNENQSQHVPNNPVQASSVQRVEHKHLESCIDRYRAVEQKPCADKPLSHIRGKGAIHQILVARCPYARLFKW